ncbi:MAG: 3,4-dihydroxy-2-butanone-4-phosphate synthase [Phycisphaerales bacterium]|nr:3,4-dihydroxy-2-butanone-4-phosphate synthase [Phycisphaerales bacterium]
MPDTKESIIESTAFATIEEILEDLRHGKMVILTDDEDRENEGDFVLPAQFVTPEAVAFMLSVARGYMCLSLTEADCDRLELTPQSIINTSVRATPFTVAIDGHPKHGLTTGVSAQERAKTIQLAIDPSTTPSDFVRPGHINPLRSRDGGVLVRIGQTEGSLDLCRLAGLHPSAIIIEIMRDDGEMARVPDLLKLCKEHDIKMCSVKQIIEHRLSQSSIIERMEPISGTKIQTPQGEFNLIAFKSLVDPMPHLALTVGDVGTLDEYHNPIASEEPTLVRVHKRDLLGDIFNELGTSSDGASSGQTLTKSMQMIQDAGRGAIVYLRPHGIGDALSQMLSRPVDHDHTDHADKPAQSVSPTMIEYGTGSQILRALGISHLKLITNSGASYPHLESFGLTISERVKVSN